MSTELLNYFENVLGIKKVLVSETNSTPVSKPLIFIENFKSYSELEIDLTKKILVAVGLILENVEVVEIEKVDCLISFKDQPLAEQDIYSPRVLQQKPELKKLAWEKLKAIRP